jgi:hypothetical protein
MAARFGEGETAGHQAGTLRAVDPKVAVVPDSVSDVVYAQHAPGTARTDDPELATWSIEWTAPLAGGAVRIHAAANSANGDDSPLGDLVYTTEARTTSRVGDPAKTASPKARR